MPINHPLIALALSESLHTGQVRPRTGLTETLTPDILAGEQPGQQALLEFLLAVVGARGACGSMRSRSPIGSIRAGPDRTGSAPDRFGSDRLGPPSRYSFRSILDPRCDKTGHSREFLEIKLSVIWSRAG